MANVATRKEFLVFGAPIVGPDEIAEVIATLEGGWLGTGPRVTRFEREFGAYKGAAHAVAVNSCTAALHVSLLAAGLEPGDEVVTTPLTFCATINAILHAGATPVLADVDPLTMNLDPRSVRDALSVRTRAILPVHFAGRPCAMDGLMAIAAERDLVVIEDCAHATESEYHGRKAGTFGDFGCFSFYATKNMTTGEGGMVIARDPAQAQRARRLALHGLSQDAWRRFSATGYQDYEVVEAGFKYNMMDLQAAIGIHQLARLEGFWLRRQEVWNRYQEAFKDLPIGLPADPEPETRHAFHLYTVRIDPERCGITRNAFLEAMTARKIGVGVHYQAIPEHVFYRRRFGWDPETWPAATQIGRETVSLPLTPRLSDRDVDDVISAVRSIVRPT